MVEMLRLRRTSSLRCSFFAQYDSILCCARLPHPAGVLPNHLLSGLASECLFEFRHIRKHVVDAELRQRMRIGGDKHARDLRTDVRAPGIGIGQEETLAIRPAILSFVVE